MGDFRVNKGVHYYICPYCKPDRKSYLKESKESDVDFIYEDCDDDDCIELPQYTCNKCKEHFLATDNFLKEQKRKIKYG